MCKYGTSLSALLIKEVLMVTIQGLAQPLRRGNIKKPHPGHRPGKQARPGRDAGVLVAMWERRGGSAEACSQSRPRKPWAAPSREKGRKGNGRRPGTSPLAGALEAPLWAGGPGLEEGGRAKEEGRHWSCCSSLPCWYPESGPKLCWAYSPSEPQNLDQKKSANNPQGFVGLGQVSRNLMFAVGPSSACLKPRQHL